MRSAKSTLHQIAQAHFYLVARLIAFLLPEHLWYRTLFRICRVEQHLIRPLLAFTPYRDDQRGRIILTWLVESSLLHLISLGRAFPVPVRQRGLDQILQSRSNAKGLVLCSVHLPLIRWGLHALVDAGVPPTAVIAHETALNGGRISVWGTEADLPGLAAGRDVLFKVRTILRGGGFVATLIDFDLGEPLNINMFRLVRSAGARVVFMVSELQLDGAILIEFHSPPDPFCLSDESVVSNLLFLQAKTNGVLRRPVPPNEAAVVPANKAASQPKVATLELDSFS